MQSKIDRNVSKNMTTLKATKVPEGVVVFLDKGITSQEDIIERFQKEINEPVISINKDVINILDVEGISDITNKKGSQRKQPLSKEISKKIMVSIGHATEKDLRNTRNLAYVKGSLIGLEYRVDDNNLIKESEDWARNVYVLADVPEELISKYDFAINEK